MPFFLCLFSLCSLAIYHWMFDEATVVEKNRNRVIAWTRLALKSLLCVFTSLYICVMLSLGWPSFSAALCPVSLLEHKAEVGGPGVPPLFGLCVANPASVPLLFRIQRTIPYYALWTCLCFTVWDFPGKQWKRKVGEDAFFEPCKYQPVSGKKKKFIGSKKVIVWSSLMQVRFLQLVIGGNITGFFPLTIRMLWIKEFAAWSVRICLLRVQTITLGCLFCFPAWPWKFSTFPYLIPYTETLSGQE